MKILVVGNLYPPVVYGGYEILCEQVVNSLRRRGHEVEVLTSSFRAEEAAPEPGVHRTLLLTTDFPRPGETAAPRVDFSLPRLQQVAAYNRARAAEVLHRFRPDLVFGWCFNRLSLGPVYAADQLGIPVVMTFNDEHPRQFRPHPNWLRRTAQRLLWPQATYANLGRLPRMTAISEALKSRLLGFGVPAREAVVIHQGIQLDRLPCAPLERTGPELRLMYAGQLSAAKGVHTLIEAVGQLRGLPFELDLFGDGVADYEARLRQRVRELGLEARVNFRGRVAHAEVCRQYSQHHVLVFPSEWQEPFGLSHLEAMACGAAVVSTTTGGTAELVRHEVNALAFPAGEAPELARQLTRLAQDEALRARLIEAARQWVEERHAFEGYVDRLEGLLRAS